jgi:hypothetical protein
MMGESMSLSELQSLRAVDVPSSAKTDVKFSRVWETRTAIPPGPTGRDICEL